MAVGEWLYENRTWLLSCQACGRPLPLDPLGVFPTADELADVEVACWHCGGVNRTAARLARSGMTQQSSIASLSMLLRSERERHAVEGIRYGLEHVPGSLDVDVCLRSLACPSCEAPLELISLDSRSPERQKADGTTPIDCPDCGAAYEARPVPAWLANDSTLSHVIVPAPAADGPVASAVCTGCEREHAFDTSSPRAVRCVCDEMVSVPADKWQALHPTPRDPPCFYARVALTPEVLKKGARRSLVFGSTILALVLVGLLAVLLAPGVDRPPLWATALLTALGVLSAILASRRALELFDIARQLAQRRCPGDAIAPRGPYR